ncbi:hypothetical protein NLX83_37235 [Allokutzneria sp. A3M-2-11 16]|uniref:hypothetical protein n=1 Tax=Allokutzneria sp. A3M-2-11 16 TaxID=2962043 RepID=UPI0020B8486C|nr:hypothetical protein [Allokutzneria sp. A3M-2-11 16]MCP3804925.1 hypothetical protein [Allokutzneria sp. A3M-2-11 16]
MPGNDADLQHVLDQLRRGRTSALEEYCGRQHRSAYPGDALVTRALAEAARGRWPELDRAAVADFARGLADRDLGVTISALFAEAVIRSALGETHLTAELPVEYRFPWSIALINALEGDGE